MVTSIVHLAHHYIEIEGKGIQRPPGPNCTPERFEAQIVMLKNAGYEFLTCAEIADRVRRRRPLPDCLANVSFDDTLFSQKMAADIMEKHGARGTFSCNSGPSAGVIPGPIAFQMLIALFGVKRLEEEILPNVFAGSPYLDILDRTRYRLRERKKGEPRHLRRIKTMINDFTPQKLKMEALNRVFAEYAATRTKQRLLEAWFMSDDTLRGLHRSGHEIAAHTDDHPALDTMACAEVLEQVRTCNQRLGDIIGKPVVSFAWTFGGMFRPQVRSAVLQHYPEGGLWNYNSGMKKIPQTAYDDLSDIPRLNGVGFPFK